MSRKPFGDPDGARAPLNLHHNDFIHLAPRYGAVGQPITEFLRTQVIVGGQGAGKTRFLRRLQNHYEDDDSVNSTPPILETSSLDTETVINFAQLFDKNINSERWSAVWRNAIYLAVARALLTSEELKHGSADEAQIKELRSAANSLGFDGEEDVVEIAGAICRRIRGKTAFSPDVQHSRDWLRLRNAVRPVLAESREQYVFVDAIDDNFHHAPAYWMACQRGLFYATMHIEKREVFRSKIHVVISVRDIVMSSVLRGEHGARYAGDASIVDLNWPWTAAERFFELKVDGLESEFFSSPESKTVEQLMGRDEIFNSARGRPEPIRQYLLRHTRLCPRDIIMLGNDLIHEADSRAVAPSRLTDAQVRATVARSATDFANWNLAQASNQIRTNIMPWSASRNNETNVYFSNREDEYTAEAMVREICSILASCGSEVFGLSRLDLMDERAERIFGKGAYFSEVMWQNGIIGCVSLDGQPEFYRSWRTHRAQLPASENYVLNPLLLDKLPEVDLVPDLDMSI